MSKHPYNWQPVRHTVLKDEALADLIHEEGIAVRPFLEAGQLEQLRNLFEETHSIPKGDGGMFYSLYSQDLEYRKKIHDTIQEILQPTLDQHFQGYKNVINSFVVKVPGKASEFSIHQDTTALDEFKYSPLTAWIPLWDITEENGAMCVVPKTHRLFSPYRGISFPFPFKNIMGTVREYLQPVTLKAGEAVFFDPRILHNSLPNTTDKPRVAIICGIFPEEAEFVINYKASPEAKIELFKQQDDFLLVYPNFMHNCHSRPVAGEVIGEVEDRFEQMEAGTFRKMATGLGLAPANLIPPPVDINCNMIAEPDATDREPLVRPEPVAAQVPEKKAGFFSRIFGKG